MALRDFAVEIESLFEAGLNKSEVRWLIAKGLFEHFYEMSIDEKVYRQIEIKNCVLFHTTSSFALTPQGVEMAASILSYRSNGFPSFQPIVLTSLRSDADGHLQVNSIPRWNSKIRELGFFDLPVKTFRVPACNQTTFLDAFKHESWPNRIDVPRPLENGIEPRTRLHDAIHRLNGRQINRLIQFGGDGTGTGISWKPTSFAAKMRPERVLKKFPVY